MKNFIVMLAVTVALFSFFACKKKEKEPVQPAPAQGPIVSPHSAVPSQGMPPHNGLQQRKTERKVVIPADIKESWAAVMLVVNDKKMGKQQSFTVELGKELAVPDSKLVIKAVYFLPDFSMTDQTITSASNETNQPSAGVTIYENGERIFPVSGEVAWLFSKVPSMHPFQHERFEVTLKEGVRK